MSDEEKALTDTKDPTVMTDYSYASLKERLLAFLIDMIIVYAAADVLISLDSAYPASLFRYMMIAGSLAVPYFLSVWMISGQSMGSRVVGIKTISEPGQNWTGVRLLLRGAMMFVFAAPYGIMFLFAVMTLLVTFFWTLRMSPFKERRQTVWDVACRTVVIND
ncbi:MAG: RDD family protein [Candidatus Omnitrophota bacterium]